MTATSVQNLVPNWFQNRRGNMWTAVPCSSRLRSGFKSFILYMLQNMPL